MSIQSTRVRYPRHVPSVEERDRELIASVDSALAESARRSGAWLVCRPGCTDCCLGGFEITELDALRLRRGLTLLEAADPERAARVCARAAVWRDEEDDPCPALDPAAGTCDLYEWRPITCRVFGPPVTCGPNATGVCDLCYHGATEEQIHACGVEADPDGIETSLLIQIGAASRRTVVAEALRRGTLDQSGGAHAQHAGSQSSDGAGAQSL